MGLFASVAIAVVIDTGTYDLTVPDKNSSSPLVSLGNASAEYIGTSAANEASGTGLFDPLVPPSGQPDREGLQHRRRRRVRHEDG